MAYSVSLIKEPWFEFEREVVDDAPQFKGKPFYQINEPNGALICAFTPDGKLILVRQFRPAVEHYVLDFPAGGVDDGEIPEQAAARELYEETGYICKELHFAGVGWSAVERINTAVFVYFGRGAVKDDKIMPEEGIEVFTVTIEELKEMILKDEFRMFFGLGVLLLIKWKLAPKELENFF